MRRKVIPRRLLPAIFALGGSILVQQAAARHPTGTWLGAQPGAGAAPTRALGFALPACPLSTLSQRSGALGVLGRTANVRSIPSATSRRTISAHMGARRRPRDLLASTAAGGEWTGAEVPGEHTSGENSSLPAPPTTTGEALSGHGADVPAEDYIHRSSSPSPTSSAGSQVVPSLGTLLRFTLPTLGIWLAGPIMSLVDTSVVGLRSSIELAAMGPATNVCDSMLYVFTFLAVATTNLLAEALAKDDEQESQRVVSHALAVSALAGLGVLGIITLLGPTLLARTIGGTDGPQLVPVCLKYTSIRAWGAPAVLLSMVAQSALLGAKDSITPLFVTLLAGLINFVGDVGLVLFGGMGLRGAAIATVAAEIAGTSILLRTLQRFQGRQRHHPFISLPSMPELGKFFKFAGPIFFALLGKTLCYSALGVAAQQCGTVPLAAHQVMLRLFFFFTPFGDSLSTTAQAFLPGMLSQKNRAGVSTVIRRIVVISLGVGGLNAMLAGLIPYLVPHFFTTSAAIALQMQDLSQLLSGSLVAHACTMALEGVLLAERELTYLAGCYALNTALILVALAMLGGRTIAISSVWVTLLAFQAIRLVQFGGKLAIKHRLVGKGWTWCKGLVSRARRRGEQGRGDEWQGAKA